MAKKVKIRPYYANDDLMQCPTTGNEKVTEKTVNEWIENMGGWSPAMDFLLNLYFPKWYEWKRETERMRRANAMRENKNSKGGDKSHMAVMRSKIRTPD